MTDLMVITSEHLKTSPHFELTFLVAFHSECHIRRKGVHFVYFFFSMSLSGFPSFHLCLLSIVYVSTSYLFLLLTLPTCFFLCLALSSFFSSSLLSPIFSSSCLLSPIFSPPTCSLPFFFSLPACCLLFSLRLAVTFFFLLQLALALSPLFFFLLP